MTAAITPGLQPAAAGGRPTVPRRPPRPSTHAARDPRVQRPLRRAVRAVRVPRLLDGEHVIPAEQRDPRVEIHFWPDNFTLRNYETVLFDPGRTPFLPAAANSLIVTITTVAVALVFASSRRSR